MNTAKVINFQAVMPRIKETDVLWVIAVHPDFQEDCSGTFDFKKGKIDIRVKAKTLTCAMQLAEKCRRAMGMEA